MCPNKLLNSVLYDTDTVSESKRFSDNIYICITRVVLQFWISLRVCVISAVHFNIQEAVMIGMYCKMFQKDRKLIKKLNWDLSHTSHNESFVSKMRNLVCCIYTNIELVCNTLRKHSNVDFGIPGILKAMPLKYPYRKDFKQFQKIQKNIYLIEK